jgi:hypothetical protein
VTVSGHALLANAKRVSPFHSITTGFGLRTTWQACCELVLRQQ